MIAVDANNIWLPLDGDEHYADEYDRSVIVEASVRVQRRWESAPIFEELQRTFWFERFADMPYDELRETCKALGLRYRSKDGDLGGTKPALVDKLTKYFRAYTEYAAMRKPVGG